MTIHPASLVDASARLGEGVRVWQFATVLGETEIGAGSVVGSCVWIGQGCRIGRNVRLNHGAFVPHGTVIEDDVFIGPNVTLTDDRYPRAGNRRYRAEPPAIRAGASLGAGCVVLPGVEIGAGAMIGAGAIVTRDVAAGMTVIGRPGRAA
jgi:acetyltransferase-like isoleucine patch superfamily enzyme